MTEKAVTEIELRDKAIELYRDVRKYYTSVDLKETNVKEIRETVMYILNSAELLIKRIKML